MYLRGRPASLLIGLSAFFFILIAIHAQYSDAASAAARRPATEDDMKWLLPWSGIPNPTVGMTISPDDPFSGQAQSEAKKWLAEHTKLNKSRIICLNPQFAQKLKAFMEKVPGGPPEITGAYRTFQEQQNIINKGDGATRVKTPCGSNHPYGLAVDFNNTSRQTVQWMRNNLEDTGITVIGEWDFAHFQNSPSRIGPCGACQAEGLGDTSIGGSGGPGGASGSPISAFSNAIRQWMNPQPQPPQQQPTPQQPLSQSPLDSFQTASSSNTNLNSNINVNTNDTDVPSVADQLEELAFGSGTATSSASTTSVPLVVSGSDAVGISSNQNPTGNQQTSGSGISSPSQQTFISGDLSWQGGSITGTPLTGWQATLAAIKATLLRILVYLKPFGGEEHFSHGLE